MSKITVTDESWFKIAPFHDIKSLAVQHLGVPEEKFVGKQPEHFKRAMVRQLYVKDHDYGEEFDIAAEANPFGNVKPRTRNMSVSAALTGNYTFVKNGQRAEPGSDKALMMEVIQRNTTFEASLTEWKEKFDNRKAKNSGKGEVSMVDMLKWASDPKRGWIVKD